MATRDFNASWADIYNASGGWSLAHHNHPIRTGGGSGTNWQTLIRIPDAVKTAIRESSTPAQLHMRIYFTSSANEIDIGHHRERNRRSVGARGIPWYAYNETWRGITNGWNSYQMTNWFMPQFLSGNVQGIVLYSYNGQFNNTATGVGQTNSVRFRVTGTWNTAPSTPSNVRIDKNPADISQTVRWNASTDAEGDSLVYQLEYHNGLSWRRISSGHSGTSYNFNTTNERNTNQAKFRVRAYDGELYSSWRNSPEFRVEHVPPQITASMVGYADINASTTAITGNNMQMIQNASIPRISVSGASANDGKTIRRYIVSLDGQERSSTTTGTFTFDPIKASSNQTLRVTVEDSAGLRSSTTRTIEVLPYELPKVQYTAERVGSIDDATILSVSGSISSVNGRNSLQTTRYRYRQVGGNWTTWRTLNRSISGNNFTASNVTLNLNNDLEWEIQIQITDRVSTRDIYADVGRGAPIMFIDEENDRLGIGKYPARGALDVDGEVYLNGKVMALGGLGFEDTRSIKDNPQDIPSRAFSMAFKQAGAVGNPPERAHSTYAHILNIAGWNSNEDSGGYPIQMSIGGKGISLRQGTSPTAWSPWTSLISGSSDSNPSITSGSNSNGRWIRFPDGTQICWNSQNHGSLALNLAWGSLYGNAPSTVNNFPVSFKSVPTVIKSITSSSHTVIMATVNPAPTTSHPGRFEAERATPATVSNLTTHYIAIGRWK